MYIHDQPQGRPQKAIRRDTQERQVYIQKDIHQITHNTTQDVTQRVALTRCTMYILRALQQQIQRHIPDETQHRTQYEIQHGHEGPQSPARSCLVYIQRKPHDETQELEQTLRPGYSRPRLYIHSVVRHPKQWKGPAYQQGITVHTSRHTQAITSIEQNTTQRLSAQKHRRQ